MTIAVPLFVTQFLRWFDLQVTLSLLGALSKLAVLPQDSHLVLQELAMDRITVSCPHFMIAKKTFQM